LKTKIATRYNYLEGTQDGQARAWSY